MTMTLHDIQAAVRVAKDKKNEFGGYNYRTAEGILAAAKAALPEGAHIVITDTMQEVAGQIFVTATATLYLPDSGEHSASGHAMHPLQKKGMDPSQITGAASSYARKYALSGLLALDDSSNDPDAGNPHDHEAAERAARVAAAVAEIEAQDTLNGLAATWTANKGLQHVPAVFKAKERRKADLSAELSS